MAAALNLNLYCMARLGGAQGRPATPPPLQATHTPATASGAAARVQRQHRPSPTCHSASAVALAPTLSSTSAAAEAHCARPPTSRSASSSTSQEHTTSNLLWLADKLLEAYQLPPEALYHHHHHHHQHEPTGASTHSVAAWLAHKGIHSTQREPSFAPHPTKRSWESGSRTTHDGSTATAHSHHDDEQEEDSEDASAGLRGGSR